MTTEKASPPKDQGVPVKRNWIDNVKDDVEWSTIQLTKYQSLQETESKNNPSSDHDNPIQVSNPDVPLPEGLQHAPHFLTPDEIKQAIDLVPLQDNQAYTWEGFDHRRRVWKFASTEDDSQMMSRRYQNDKMLPDTNGILARIRQRVAQQFTHLPQHCSHWSVSIQEYPTRKINLSGEYASNQTVTNHESLALLYAHTNNSDDDHDDRDHNEYFVAYVALNRTAIQHLHLPATRRGVSWSLKSPVHYTDIQIIPGTLWIKQGAALHDWRYQLRATQNKRQEPVWVLRVECLPPPLSNRIVHAIRDDDSHNNNQEVEEAFGYMNTPANQRLQQERQSTPRPPMANLLTIIITTSPIRSNPETELLEKIAETFIHAGEEFAYECPKVIVCDGVRRTSDQEGGRDTDQSTTAASDNSKNGQTQPGPKVTKKHNTDKQAMRNGIVNSDQAERYEQFKANLQKLCQEAGPRSFFANTTVHELEERQGYGFALRHALRHCVHTPFVCVIQHDRTFMRPTPMTEVLDAMWNHPNIKYVGINMRSNLTYRDTVCSKYGGAYVEEYLDMVLRPPELLVSAEDYGPHGSSFPTMKDGCHPKIWKSIQSTAQAYLTSQQNLGQEEWLARNSLPPGKHQLSLSPTLFWFDNVHVVETAFYRDFVFDPMRKMVVRGGFVEDKLSPVLIRTCERLGLTEGHARFGCYILDDHSGAFFTGHLDGGNYMTKEQKQERAKVGRKQPKQKTASVENATPDTSLASKGGTTTVVYAMQKDAKKAKDLLDKSGFLDKDYRMGPSKDDDFAEMIAIPVCIEGDLDAEMMGIEGIVGHGKQICPFSTGVLGNHKGKIQSVSQKERVTPIEQALLTSLKQSTSDWKSDEEVLEQLRKLGNKVIPKRPEVFGDDRTLVIHSRVLSENDLAFSSFLDELGIRTREQKDEFFLILWEKLAIELESPRVVRKGEVQPESRVRESNFRILWPRQDAEPKLSGKIRASQQFMILLTDAAWKSLASYLYHVFNLAGPGSPGWITVTEQGIRQSFDMTRVMFSRGNITEKVRFGKLVKPGEVVLDLYAGIGYFTLPARTSYWT